MKVLIISHNPVSPQNSIGKTLMSLFSEFKSDELCQIYINCKKPQKNFCSSYFRISDKDIIKGVFSRKVKETEIFDYLDGQEQEQSADSIVKSKEKINHYLLELIRDLLWSLAPWRNKALKGWLAKEKPTCIFAAVGSGGFLYNLAVYISKLCNIPIYTYVCDDYYFMKSPNEIIGKIWKTRLDRTTRKLMAATESIFCICQDMSNRYSEKFKKSAFTVMTGSTIQIAKNPKEISEVSNIRYFGKLSLNRYKSIFTLGKAIDNINKKDGTRISFDLYCGNVSDEIKEYYKDIDCIELHDFIYGEQFENEFFSSDALVHVEAFDEKSVDRVRYSISTKIADSLASGIPLIAHGPDSVSSVRHLIDNNCALAVTDEQLLEERLSEFIHNKDMRINIVENAIKTAERYHNSKSVSKTVYDTLNKTL